MAYAPPPRPGRPPVKSERVSCPWCGCTVAKTADGVIYKHGAAGNPCKGSGMVVR